MKSGKTEKIQWHKYKTTEFRFPQNWENSECGASALYTITRESKKKIMKLSQKGEWPIKTMKNFLNRYGFEMIPLTIGNLVQPYDYYMRYKISNLHVLLIDQAAAQDENTWTVVYDGKQSHSGTLENLHILEFINFPIENIYVIWHEDWVI